MTPARAQHMRFPVSAMLAVCCAAAALAGCGSGSGPDVLTAPIRVVRTSAGTVAYRELGSGPALLLITGADASMDGWPPSFVDALAAHHKVVVFDNAGVGRTSAVSAPASLSITAMASQTSALISALRLRRPAVLGWSMGGMIAQALAVSHPAQVSRLILAATAAGTGKALPLPPSTTVFGLSSAKLEAQLFPKNQAAAASAYLNAIQQYPGFYGYPPPHFTASTSQLSDGWQDGTQRAGWWEIFGCPRWSPAEPGIGSWRRPTTGSWPAACPARNCFSLTMPATPSGSRMQRGSSEPSRPL
jgi:pimeloyl-ACP methyl ester carboxylesterase